MEIMKTRIRLFFSRKVLVVLFVVFPLFLAIISTGYLASDEVEMKTRIGIVDLDGSDLSISLVEGLKKDKTLSVFQYDMEEGQSRLMDESVTGLYTIKEGFGDMVEEGETHDLITIQYLSDNYMASGITDIITPYFMLDILKNVTIDEMGMIFKDEKTLDRFTSLFNQKAVHYGEEEDLQLEVATEIVKGQFESPAYSLSKEMLIGYLLGMILMFHLVSSFYQSMGLYEDEDSRILDRIRMSGRNELEYIVGNILGIGLMIFVVSLIQALILKILFFTYLDLRVITVDLLAYSISVSSFSVMLSRIFGRRMDYMTAVPFLVIGMWLLGNLSYASGMFNNDVFSLVSLIPGMASRDHIVKSFIAHSADIDMTVVLKEISAAAIMTLLASIMKGGRKSRGNRT